jgi:guanylate kinase
MRKPIVCIITGPCGAGKSTISKSLAKQIKKSAYIDVDILRDRMVRNGGVSPFFYKGESKKQIDLAIKNTSDLTNNFLKAGFNVFIDDVLERKQQVKNYLKNIKSPRVYVFLLLPNRDVLKKRDSKRKKEDIMGQRALDLHDIFTKRIPEENWHVLDTSNHITKETETEILKILKIK